MPPITVWFQRRLQINDYTACLKVGKKQGGAIQPVDSADENLICVDPDCLQRSRLTASVVLMDDETRAPGFRAPE